MQRWKGTKPSFDEVLDHLYEKLNRYEPSFASKLVATLDPDQPVWDKYVLEHLNIIAPSYASKAKVRLAKATYARIKEWYKQFLDSPKGRCLVGVFDCLVPEHPEITDVKKVAFVLWQTRILPAAAGDKTAADGTSQRQPPGKPGG